MDSLLVAKLTELRNLQDTLISHSHQLQTSIDNIKSSCHRIDCNHNR